MIYQKLINKIRICAKRQQHQQNAKETSYFIIKVLAVK